MHIHAQSAVELDHRVFLCLMDLLSVLLSQLWSQLLAHSLSCLIQSRWTFWSCLFGAIGIRARGSVEACADLEVCHLDGGYLRPQQIKLKRTGPRARWVVTTRCFVGPDVHGIVNTWGFKGLGARWSVTARGLCGSGRMLERENIRLSWIRAYAGSWKHEILRIRAYFAWVKIFGKPKLSYFASIGSAQSGNYRI